MEDHVESRNSLFFEGKACNGEKEAQIPEGPERRGSGDALRSFF